MNEREDMFDRALPLFGARYSCFKMSGADLISRDKRYLFGAPIFPARQRRTYDASTSPAAGGTKDEEAGDGVRTAGGSSE